MHQLDVCGCMLCDHESGSMLDVSGCMLCVSGCMLCESGCMLGVSTRDSTIFARSPTTRQQYYALFYASLASVF